MQTRLTPQSDEPVLIIDDLLSARLLLADMLTELGFTRCLHARNGREALDMMRLVPVQLVFCDFMMDEMNGPEFLKALQSTKVKNVPPIIFISSMGDIRSVQTALQEGAYDYLVKPVDFAKLRQKVERALLRRQHTPDTSYRARAPYPRMP
jgi:two-component system chemotaxis response regulator CheY